MTGIEVPRDHAGLEVLSYQECLMLAATQPVGRLAYGHGDGIEIFPVNHVVIDGMVAFRRAEGSTLSGVMGVNFAAYEVDGYDARRREGWSVVFKGRVEAVTSPTMLLRLHDTGLQPWRNRVPRPAWLTLRPHVVTGRRL